MEDSQTTVEMETPPPKTLTSDPDMLPDDDAQNSKPVSDVKSINNQFKTYRYMIIQQMEENQASIEWEKPNTETTNLPDDGAENPVSGNRYPTILFIHSRWTHWRSG